MLSAEQWKEQRETFRRCQNINAEVDHFPPKTFMNLRDKLAKNKAAKKGDFEDREHQRNLQALRARIQDVGNEQHRKKNRFDPLNDPVRLFRKDQAQAKKMSIQSFKEKVAQKQLETKKKNDEIAQQWLLSQKEHSQA